jgi:hypothetical protein
MKKGGGGERENWDLTTKDTKKHEGIGTRVAIAFPEHFKLHCISPMKPHFQKIIDTVEPLPDSIYGPRYRCSLTLTDGTYLPCAILQSKSKIVELAKRRFDKERDGKGILRSPDPYGQIVASFVTGGNRINDYDVADTEQSKFAPSISLLKQIHGETTMGWTGWVFEMRDGRLFQYGSSFTMEFFQIPEGYSFDDIVKVHNHSFLSGDGRLQSLMQGARLTKEYDIRNVYRERVYFNCALEGI